MSRRPEPPGKEPGEAATLATVPSAYFTRRELDCLAVVWEAEVAGKSMRLSEIHRIICERRLRAGEEPPALTTISTQLRNLVAKALLTTVGPFTGGGTRVQKPGPGGGATARPLPRSPNTAYRSATSARAVLANALRPLAEACPADSREHALTEFARCLGIRADVVEELQRLLSQATANE